MTAPNTEASANDPLGTEIFRCRPRSPLRNVGGDGPGFVFMSAFFLLFAFPLCAAFFGGWAWFAAKGVWEGQPREVVLAILAIAVIGVYLLIIWLVYLHPRGDYLVVHERGFRIRMSFKSRMIKFSDLREVTFGLHSAFMEAAIGALAVVKPGRARGARAMAEAMMTVHYQNGRKTSFKMLLFRFESDDTVRFIEYIKQHQPNFGQPAQDSSPSGAPQ